MTAYVGADVVYGPVKVVDRGAETPTVVGTFRIYQKHATKTMRGANADGTAVRDRGRAVDLVLPPRLRPPRGAVALVVRLLRLPRLRQPAGGRGEVGLRLRADRHAVTTHH